MEFSCSTSFIHFFKYLSLSFFLAHLSRRLKWAIVIAHRPSSVVRKLFIFLTSPPKPLNRFWRNLTESKNSTSSTNFVFFVPIRHQRWPPWPLIGWDINDFSSETTERNSTKLYRKQDLNVLYQFLFFWPIRKTGWPPWPLIGWDILDFSKTAERNSTKLDRKQDLNVLYHVCVFRVDRKKQDGRPGLWLAETFSTSPLKLLNGIQRHLTGSKISTSSTKFVFFGPIEKKMAALASDWLGHFRLLLWNGWTEFNETWQEARSQRPVCVFSGRSEKQDGRPGLFFQFSYEI